MSDHKYHPPFRRLVILGAGFSKPAGLSLANELMQPILRMCSNTGDTGKCLLQDIERFAHYEKKRTGNLVPLDSINIERLGSFLDIEHFLGLQIDGGDYESGNRSQMILRSFIARVLYDRQKAMNRNQWELYESFVQHLHPGDIVVSFNYDTILETACESMGQPFRLCDHRYESKHKSGRGWTISPKEDKEISIRKMHGSIDWIDDSEYIKTRNMTESWTFRSRYHHPAFDSSDQYGMEPLIGKPYPKDDPLCHLFRVRNLEQFLSVDFAGGTIAPSILLPSYAKIAYLKPLLQFWRGFNAAGTGSSQLIVIGFSFSPHDEYALQPIIQAIDNFQSPCEPRDMIWKPLEMCLVDFQDDSNKQNIYKKKHPYIDWNTTKAFWDGFRGEDIPKLLPKSIRTDRP